MKKNSKKILIIEDEPELAELFTLALKNQGYRVFQINDGAQALAKISEVKPDLILLDLVLPNVNGFEILKELKKNSRAGHQPLVYVWSNLTQREEIKKATQLGTDGFFIKSDYTPDSLAAEIEKKLK